LTHRISVTDRYYIYIYIIYIYIIYIYIYIIYAPAGSCYQTSITTLQLIETPGATFLSPLFPLRQALARGVLARRRYVEKLRNVKAVVIQKNVRRWLATRRYSLILHGIIKIQSHYRRRKAKLQLKILKVRYKAKLQLNVY